MAVNNFNLIVFSSFCKLVVEIKISTYNHTCIVSNLNLKKVWNIKTFKQINQKLYYNLSWMVLTEKMSEYLYSCVLN